MNNAYFERKMKLQTRNRAGRIRSYRTSRICTEMLIMVLDMILFMLDQTLDVLARPAVLRLIRGVVAIACVVGFVLLIGAIDHQWISLFHGIVISAVLVFLEVLCLRG
jgi:hypothetical protein